MATRYVLVDFENVQPNDTRLLNGGRFKVKVFLGANQAKIPLDVAQTLQRLGPDAEYVQVDGIAGNALDFYIAYYIGRLSAREPDAEFHVVTRDTGFDPLIKHLNALGIRCHRSKTMGEIVGGGKAPLEGVDASISAVMQALAKPKTPRPRTRKRMQGWLKSFFENRIEGKAIDDVLEQLTKRKAIRVNGEKIEYLLDGEPG